MKDIRDFTDEDIKKLAIQRLQFETEFDHLKLIQNVRSEVRRYLRAVRKAVKRSPRVLDRIAIAHEHDESCCAKEPWTKPNERLMNHLTDKILKGRKRAKQ